MSLDTQIIGQFVAQLMEQLDERDFAENAKVRTVALAVEVDDDDAGQLLVACTDDRPWVQVAFLGAARHSLVRALNAALRDDE